MRPVAGLALAALMIVAPAMPLWTGTAAAQDRGGGLPAGLKDSPLPLPGASGHASRNSATDAVRFISPAQVTIAAHRSVEVDLHFRVAEGLHIHSHAPGDKTLIPTRLAIAEANGVEVMAVDFPPGASYAPAFSPKEKLSVYTGDFVLRAHLRARRGEHSLEGALRYQACDVNSCMPPRTLPVEVSVDAEGP